MVRAFMCACLLGAVFVAPAAAVKPMMDRIPVAADSLHVALSALCGFDVWFTAMGHITFRLMTDNDGNPVREVNNFAIRRTFSSEFGSVSTVDVGPDRVIYNDDGSLNIWTTGNVQSLHAPGQGLVFANAGWVQIHVTFDENGDESVEFISQAGHHSDADQALIICGLLAPA